MDQKQLNLIKEQHKMWLNDEEGGRRANLCGANLCGANLRGANLRDANLRDANLRDANLRDANLRDANLCDANLRDANLRDANLYSANLCDANLRDANLCDANLRDANLRDANLYSANLHNADLCGANLCDANLHSANLCDANLCGANLRGADANEHTSMFHLQCPEEGAFVGWKKCCDKVIVKLLIPEDAKRSSSTSRKCRCDKAVVLEIFGSDVGISQHDSDFVYKKGETVMVDDFNDDRWIECAEGIHFFITRKEAESY